MWLEAPARSLVPCRAPKQAEVPRSPAQAPHTCAFDVPAAAPSRSITSSALFCPAGVSRCVAERKYTQEQARKEFQQVFIPECNDDGTYSQVTWCPGWSGTPSGWPGSSLPAQF